MTNFSRSLAIIKCTYFYARKYSANDDEEAFTAGNLYARYKNLYIPLHYAHIMRAVTIITTLREKNYVARWDGEGGWEGKQETYHE